MTRTALALAGVLLVSPSLFAQGGEEALARARAAYAERGRGFLETGAVDPEPIGRAVAAFEEAVAAAPEELGRRFELVEALYFQGHFATSEGEARKSIYRRMVALAEELWSRVDALTGRRAELARLPFDAEHLAARAAIEQAVPEAARAHFWLSISRGLLATTQSPLAAVREGAATRIRDHTQMVVLLDETYADAGGLRILGRLHTQAPRVPFITGWVDRETGIALLRRALEHSRRDPRNLLFLAEALHRFAADGDGEALALARELAGRRPAPERVVEDGETLAAARRLLAELEPQGRSGRRAP